eukprot:TRINITY_DN1664_c0_g1_i6.p1 TRINITY_DN1664_c0_g1~~TRINITY_DN1664_c0_g1_i6.p1  ORF type:complete len:167 (-),score=17.55 TRINITY_DN1664_c0_g1_i6:80-580(-)
MWENVTYLQAAHTHRMMEKSNYLKRRDVEALTHGGECDEEVCATTHIGATQGPECRRARLIGTSMDGRPMDHSIPFHQIDPLDFWKTVGHLHFPYWTRVARMLLAVPATTGTDERLFSICGDVDDKAKGKTDILPLLVAIRRNVRLLGNCTFDIVSAILEHMEKDD